MIKSSPQAKILSYILLIIIAFLSNSFKVSLILLGLVLIFAFKVPLSVLKKGLLPITFFLTFTFLSNILFEEGRVIYEVIGLAITEEGLRRGGHLTLRLFTLILGAKVLVAATTAEDLVKGMTGLLGPIGRFNVVREFIFTMSLTFRFLPVVWDEAQALYREVVSSSPGAMFTDKIKLSVSLLTPLFERSMKKAKEMSNNQ